MIYNPRQPMMSSRQASIIWLVRLDSLGFVFGFLLTLLKIPPEARNPSGHGVFLIYLGLFALLHYSNVVRESGKIQASGVALSRIAAVPLASAAGTLLVSALARSYYSGAALVIFVVFWTIWLVAVRIVSSRRFPPLRVLVVGKPEFAADLRAQPHIRLTSLHSPPAGFTDYDVVLLDSLATYSDDWLQWLLHANLAGVTAVPATTFIEDMTGQIPAEMLSARWAPELLHGRTMYVAWKRLIDLIVTVCLSPVVILLGVMIALLVYLDGGRPIFFWQERIGLNGKPFYMVKFRSMRTDAEKRGAAFARQGDSRVTPIGRFLRKYRLDEIPQFFNVLQGDMSIIGPRPEQRVFVERFAEEIPLYDIRHHVRPGITGWAQVRHGYAAGVDKAQQKLRLDFYYIKNISFWLDLQIVLKTFQTILNGFGAR